MQTSEQHVDGPDEEARALTARLADLCRRDPAAFAFFVRQNDQLRAAGVDHRLAWQLTLDAIDADRASDG